MNHPGAEPISVTLSGEVDWEWTISIPDESETHTSLIAVIASSETEALADAEAIWHERHPGQLHSYPDIFSIARAS